MGSKRKKKFLLVVIFILALIPVVVVTGKAGSANVSIYLPILTKNYAAGLVDVYGRVYDDRADTPLDNAEVCFENVGCVTTNANGEYRFEDLSSGNYHVTVTRSGYISLDMQVQVPNWPSYQYHFYLLPLLDDGEMRITLTWDDTPAWPPNNVDNDLDLHLWTPIPGYEHIYLDNKGSCQDLSALPYICLESDKRDGSGPEVLIISQAVDGIYYLGVLNYYADVQGVPPITELSAKIQVDVYGGQSYQFFVPTSGTGDLWYVLNIEDGDIVEVNCITQYQEPGDTPPVCGTP